MLLNGPLRPLLKWPGLSKWRKAMPVALAGALAIGAVAGLAGMASFSPEPAGPDTIKLLAILLLVPALGEELLFRWLLYPRSGLPGRKLLVILSVSLFVLWHPLQVWSGLGPAWSGIFLDPVFLVCVALLGSTVAMLRERTGSIWPPVLFHWMIVAAWKLGFGGPF